MPLYPDAPAAPNYAAPLLNFAPLGNLGTDFYEGAENKRKYDVARTFQGGLPRDAAGNIDFNRAAEMLATRGDASQLVPLANVDLQRKFLGSALSDSSAAFPTGQTAGPQASAAPTDQGEPRGVRNSNFGNIKDGSFARSQPGYAGSDGTFAKFETPEHGIQAATTLLGRYGQGGINTVQGVVNRWAPAGDGNNVPAYVASVSKALGVAPDAQLDLSNPQVSRALAQAMFTVENGKPVGQAGDAAPAPPERPVIPPHGIPQGSADGSPPAAPVRVAGPAMAPASPMAPAAGPATAPSAQAAAPQPQPAPAAQQPGGTMPAALRPLIPAQFNDPMQYVNFLRQKQAAYEAAGLAGVKGADGAAKAYGAQADKVMDAIGKFYELTPDQKNAAASGGLNPLQYANAQAVGKVLAENSALTPDQKLYEQAKKQGFVGTELDFQAERERLKKEGQVSAENKALTPEQKNYSSDALPGESMAQYQARVAGLKSAAEPTPEMKNAAADRRPGESIAEYQARAAGGKKYAEDEATRFGKKYDAITKAGQEASVELPQLQLAKSILNDPKFYSGPAEGLNLGYKRILATIDPSQADAAQPQEAFRKVISNSILSQIRSLAGTGQIRVAEIRIMEKAAANQENTPAANRLLVDIATRLHQHALGLDELARNYNGGRLDPGFDTAARQWTDQHQIFSPAELKDPRLIAPPIFNTPEDVKKAGLAKGSPFQTSDGRIKYVP